MATSPSLLLSVDKRSCLLWAAAIIGASQERMGGGLGCVGMGQLAHRCAQAWHASCPVLFY